MGVQINIESNWHDLDVQWAQPLDDKFLDEVRGAVVFVTNMTRNRISEEMPVDTGWASERWGISSYGGIYRESDNGLTIEHGSSIEPYEYIERLNEGYSQQAPAGFIDAAAEAAEVGLQEIIEDIAERLDD